MTASLQIDINPACCVGCKLCMLACSWVQEKAYCPDRSFIQVEVSEKVFQTKIRVDEASCTGCKMCIKSCPTGALTEGAEHL